MTTLLDDIKAGDRVYVTVRDINTDDMEAFAATVIIVSPALRSLWVRPDDTLLGLVENLLIEGDELVALVRIP